MAATAIMSSNLPLAINMEAVAAESSNERGNVFGGGYRPIGHHRTVVQPVSPSYEKSHGRAEGVFGVDVEATSLRHRCAKFGNGYSAQQRIAAACDPNQHDRPEATKLSCD